MVKNPFIQKRYKIIAKFIKAVVKGNTSQEQLQTLAIPAIKARKEVEEKYNLDQKLIYAGLVSFKLITVEELKEFLKVKNLATGNVDRSSKPIRKPKKKKKEHKYIKKENYTKSESTFSSLEGTLESFENSKNKEPRKISKNLKRNEMANYLNSKSGDYEDVVEKVQYKKSHSSLENTLENRNVEEFKFSEFDYRILGKKLEKKRLSDKKIRSQVEEKQAIIEKFYDTEFEGMIERPTILMKNIELLFNSFIWLDKNTKSNPAVVLFGLLSFKKINPSLVDKRHDELWEFCKLLEVSEKFEQNLRWIESGWEDLNVKLEEMKDSSPEELLAAIKDD